MTSGELARELGLNVQTIHRYRARGWITPSVVTPTGHARWDAASVRDEMAELNRRRLADEPDED